MMVGTIEKMRSEHKSPVEYSLPIGRDTLPLNPFLGRELFLEYTGNIYCTACGRKTRSSFNEGYCFPCSQKLASCDMCIVKPELCHFSKGTCREPEFGLRSCMQPHVVYLASSSGVKVGITREHQIPYRWIDQGATVALPIFRVMSRHVSGLIETLLAQHVPDKTDWRKMLKGDAEEADLLQTRATLLTVCRDELDTLSRTLGRGAVMPLNEQPVRIDYPVREYPQKINSQNFEKTPRVGGVLLGIKGQYLIFDAGVINMRKFTGYELRWEGEGQA